MSALLNSSSQSHSAEVPDGFISSSRKCRLCSLTTKQQSPSICCLWIYRPTSRCFNPASQSSTNKITSRQLRPLHQPISSSQLSRELPAINTETSAALQTLQLSSLPASRVLIHQRSSSSLECGRVLNSTLERPVSILGGYQSSTTHQRPWSNRHRGWGCFRKGRPLQLLLSSSHQQLWSNMHRVWGCLENVLSTRRQLLPGNTQQHLRSVKYRVWGCLGFVLFTRH
jgi:hypothetical protein